MLKPARLAGGSLASRIRDDLVARPLAADLPPGLDGEVTSPAFIAHRFVTSIDARDWEGLRSLVDEDTTVSFVHDGRTFSGPEWVRFNEEYPGVWSFVAEDIVATDQRAVVRARVFDEHAMFHVVSFLTVRDGRISDLTEVWADGHAAPTEE